MTTITKEAKELFNILIKGEINEDNIAWYIQTVWDCLPQVKLKDIQYLDYLREQKENIKKRNHLRIVDNNKKVLDNGDESWYNLYRFLKSYYYNINNNNNNILKELEMNKEQWFKFVEKYKIDTWVFIVFLLAVFVIGYVF